ncbi:sulfite exporter TauE/SafE family protein [Pelagibacteraceae bacterium]|nr:sulfite exporter TauE/SafE family protein [Pelagibacteraceae bacterium]
MDFYFPIAQVQINIFTVLILSFTVGFLSGIFGIGGGFLMTPILIFLGIPAAYAVSNVANNILGISVSGATTHWYKKTLDYKMGIMIVIGGLVGSLIGIEIFKYLREVGNINTIIALAYIYLLVIIGTIIFVQGVKELSDLKKKVVVKKKLHTHYWIHGLPFRMRFSKSKLYESALTPITLGFLVGIFASIMGIGGAFLMVPAMIYLIGMPTKLIPGTSLFVTIFITAFVVLGHALQFKSIDVSLVSFLLLGSIIGLHLGLKVAEKLNATEYKALLALLLIVFGIFIGVETFVLDSNTKVLSPRPSSELSNLSLLIIKLAKNSPITYASLSLIFVVFVGFAFSYIRELIHHFRFSKKEGAKS